MSRKVTWLAVVEKPKGVTSNVRLLCFTKIDRSQISRLWFYNPAEMPKFLKEFNAWIKDHPN